MLHTFVEHRKARFLYEIIDTYTAGIVLSGSEVKSIRNGKIDLSGSYVIIQSGEAFLLNASIASYQEKNITKKVSNVTPTRKLLLHKRELRDIYEATSQKGLTAVPLSLFENHGMIKVSLAVVRGKKIHDKREMIKKRDIDRELARG